MIPVQCLIRKISPCGRISHAAAGSSSGFILVEALAAAVIASIATLWLFLIIGHTARDHETTRDRLAALSFVQSKFAALGVEQPLEAGNFEGQLDGGMTWRLVVARDENLEKLWPSETLQPYSLTLSLTWTQEGRNQHLTFTTLKLKGRTP